MSTYSVSKHNLTRKQSDTYRIRFQIVGDDGEPMNLTSWTAFSLAVNSERKPVDVSNQVGKLSGIILDAANGKVGFPTPGTFPVGKFYYDAQALDSNGEKVTFAEGYYKVVQDIAKD